MARQKLSIRDLTSDEQRREGQKCDSAFEEFLKAEPLDAALNPTLKRAWRKAYSLGLVAGMNLRGGKPDE